MEIRQLKAFLAIAEAKTFTAGARRVILTEAGEHLMERARKILREHDAAVAEIAELAGAEHGRLRIGSASAMFATMQLPKILQNLKERFPNAEITVSSGTSQTLVDKILHGEIDIAFISLPVENSHIMTELLFSDEIVAIAHPQHPLADQKFISAAALAGEPLILGEKGGNTRRLIDDFFSAANVQPNVVMELSRQEAINQMVENDMGIGIAGAKTVAKEIKDGRLASWLIEGAEIKWDLGLARLRGGYFSPIAKEFVRFCKESFKEREKEFKTKGKS